MLKITKMLAVVVAVSAFAISATTAMGNAVWTGLGVGDSWSDMANWQDAGGNWGPTGTDEDPRTGVNCTLSTGSSLVDFDITDTNLWATKPVRVDISNHTMTLVAGGTFQNTNYFTGFSNSTFVMTGGTLVPGSYLRMDGNGKLELSGGSWTTGSYLHKPGWVQVIGSGFTYANHRFSNFYHSMHLQFTLVDNTGIATLRPTWMSWSGGIPATPIPIMVDGIQDYIDDGGAKGVTFDLVILTDGADPDMLGFSGGEVDGGLGIVTVTEDGATLYIVPEPATMALLAFGGLGVLLRRKRR